MLFCREMEKLDTWSSMYALPADWHLVGLNLDGTDHSAATGADIHIATGVRWLSSTCGWHFLITMSILNKTIKTHLKLCCVLLCIGLVLAHQIRHAANVCACCNNKEEWCKFVFYCHLSWLKCWIRLMTTQCVRIGLSSHRNQACCYLDSSLKVPASQ